MATMIVPADQPAYVPVGGNEIMLLGEFSRTVAVACVKCGKWSDDFKLIADDVLSDAQCDELLTSHLRGLGWRRLGDDDVCPDCPPDTRDGVTNE